LFFLSPGDSCRWYHSFASYINQLLLLHNSETLLAGTVDTGNYGVGAIGRFTAFESVSVNNVYADERARVINTISAGALCIFWPVAAATLKRKHHRLFRPHLPFNNC